MNDPVGGYFFPVFFVALWLFVTGVLGALSGWFRLQTSYPAGDEPSLRTLRWQSGSMGMGVAMSGVLKLSACPSGLRIGICRIFGPFQRPFLVPWDQIDAEPVKRFFAPMARLTFGRGAGRLTIDARAWQSLAGMADEFALAHRIPAVSRGRFGRVVLLQWLVMTVFAATFFIVASRLQGVPIPLAVCIGFPALGFGLGNLIRYLRQLRRG